MSKKSNKQMANHVANLWQNTFYAAFSSSVKNHDVSHAADAADEAVRRFRKMVPGAPKTGAPKPEPVPAERLGAGTSSRSKC